MSWPKHGETRGGERYDRPSMAWVPADEWAERDFWRREAAFQRAANQGELCAPRVIHDSMGALRSMSDGRLYDSKSTLRRSYREQGVEETGCAPIPAGRNKRAVEHKSAMEAVGRAFAAVDTMSDETIARRQYERRTAHGGS